MDPKQKNGYIVRDPMNHERYIVPKNKRDPTYITLIGDPPEVKGHNVFIEIAKHFPDLQFMLVTKHKYDPLEIPTNITLQGYLVNIEDLKDKVYAKTKVLLLPSAYEAFGRVTIEATASCIPCIISKYPGLPDATYNMSNYVQTKDVNGWINELQRVLNNYEMEVEKSSRIRDKLDYERDLSYFRSLVFKAIENN